MDIDHEIDVGIDIGGLLPPLAQQAKNLPAMQEMWVRSLGWEVPLEEGMATHSSILAWRMPWTEEPGHSSQGWKDLDTTATLLNFLEVQGSGICQHVLLKVTTCYCIINILPLRKRPLQTLVQFSCCHIQLLNWSTPSFPVHHQASLSIINSQSLLKLMSIELVMLSNHLILSSLSPPAFNLSQHKGLFQWVSSSHHVAKVLELQLQHQSFQWMFRTNIL